MTIKKKNIHQEQQIKKLHDCGKSHHPFSKFVEITNLPIFPTPLTSFPTNKSKEFQFHPTLISITKTKLTQPLISKKNEQIKEPSTLNPVYIFHLSSNTEPKVNRFHYLQFIESNVSASPEGLDGTLETV